MSKFVRVRDEKTGAEYSTARVLQGHKVLHDKPAVDRNGQVLPAKPRANLGAAKSAKADETSASHTEADHGKGSNSVLARQATDKKE